MPQSSLSVIIEAQTKTPIREDGRSCLDFGPTWPEVNMRIIISNVIKISGSVLNTKNDKVV